MATQEDMHAILARNTAKTDGGRRGADPTASGSGATGGVTVQLGDPAVLDNPPAAALHWKAPIWTSQKGKDGSGVIMSTCGGFTVTRDSTGSGFTYTAWDARTTPATNLGCVQTNSAAVALCEVAAHAGG